ncbi:hypothetical protein [Nocardia sp. XZ_19_385]|uniref:hypothetical protein n=1 Tax=Nocardia sp. XZ_19_385 TaxID=2769488 RepID=UPI00188EFD94|nr:hypothetical protein [Nocardia sp. XZ_19_385]
MSYPHNPGGYQPYGPTVGWEPKPSGGTAISAGVLAALGTVAQLLGGVGVLWLALATSDGLSDEDGLYAFVLVGAGFALLTAVLLGIGSVTLFLRKAIGRILIAVGCAIHILAQIASIVVSVAAVGEYADDDLIGTGLGGLIGIVFPIATLILVLLPSTARWLAYRPAEAGYPPYAPGYPPAGYPPQNPFAPNQFGGFAPPQDAYGYGPAPVFPAGQPAPDAVPTQRVDGFGDAPTQVVAGSNGASPPAQSPPANPFGKPDDDIWRRPS